MTSVTVGKLAFAKIILHAFKYPYLAVNGLLLSKKSEGNSKNIEFVDAVPLFHISPNLTPMSEIALMQVDELASKKGLTITGYYYIPENLEFSSDFSFDKVCNRVTDKLGINCDPAFLVVLNNKSMTDPHSIMIGKYSEGKYKSLSREQISVQDAEDVMIEDLLKDGLANELVDFDNHLDNISLDWMNYNLNEKIKKFM